MKRLLGAILVVTLVSSCNFQERERQLPVEQRGKLMSEADLVFEGTLTNSPAGGRANAVENAPDISFVAVFEVQKLLKGNWQKPTFAIAVHSPTLTFGQFPGGSSKKVYTNYLKANADRPGTFILIGTEWRLTPEISGSIQ